MLRVVFLYLTGKTIKISSASVIDSNPKFGADQNYANTAARVAETLWEACGGDVSTIPQYYLDQLAYEYSDGRVSLLPALDRLTSDDGMDYEEFSEAVAELIQGSYSYSPDEIVEVPVSKLLGEPPAQDFSEFDWDSMDFAEGDMGKKVGTFLSKVISSIYTDGVTRVTDAQGNPPSPENNFLMNEDGTEFKGLFFDAVGKKKFPFRLKESNGKWSVEY
jgi:hypothetical protein